jgi:iron complex transport system substrate-binding protein
VLRAHADLVLASDISRADGPALLRAAGLPVIRADTAIDTLDGIKAQMRTIAYLIGEDARGAAREAAFEGVIDRAARRRGTGAPPRVLALGSTYGFGAHTLLDDIFTRIGVENVAARHGLVGYARVSDEQILRWNPDWIVAGADAGRAGIRRAELLSRPAVAATRAGQTGRILVVENPIFLPISPFTARLVDVLSSAFYGDRP